MSGICKKPPRAECRAAPKPARIPSGDRAAYSPHEGHHV